MFFNLFSKYLLEKGKINADDLKNIKLAQTKTRVKLGLIAVSEKMLTEKQASDVNRKQAVMDKRFGDIAVELGYLTPDQVSKLLDLQGNPYMVFCQSITDCNILTLAEVEACFDDFIKENGFDDAAAEAIKADDIDKIIPLYIKNADESMIELISVSIRTINRLISTDLCMYEGVKMDTYKYPYLAAQSIEGEQNSTLAISGSKEGVLEMAGLFAAEEFTEVDMDSLDSIGEFINIINGLHATALSYRNIQVELMAPEFAESEGQITSDCLYVIPMEVNQKKFDLIVNYK